MKIVEVRAAGLRGWTPRGGWAEELKPDDVVHTLVSIRGDDGSVGMGSVFTSEALVTASLELLRPLLIGESAIEPERVTERLRRATFWMGHGGAVTHTISGIDIALWDLLGQKTGQSVGRLLGGRHRSRVLPYASLLMDEPQRMSDRLVELREQGWRAFKIGWGPFGRVDNQTDERIVSAARAAVGHESMLMVDAGASDSAWSQTFKWALRTATMLDHYEVKWFEEPLPPDALGDFVALRRVSPVDISGGEVLTRRQTFTPWLDAGAFDIVQPDVTKVGGLTEQRRIGWAAEDHGIRLIPHGWNTAIGLAADLQLASALPGTDLVEYISGSAYVDDICKAPWTFDSEGYLSIPDSPGLGVQLDLDALKRYTDLEKLFGE